MDALTVLSTAGTSVTKARRKQLKSGIKHVLGDSYRKNKELNEDQFLAFMRVMQERNMAQRSKIKHSPEDEAAAAAEPEEDVMDSTQLWQVPLPVLGEQVARDAIQKDMQLQVGGQENDPHYGLVGVVVFKGRAKVDGVKDIYVGLLLYAPRTLSSVLSVC